MSVIEQLSEETAMMTNPNIFAEIGEQILINNITEAIITDECAYASWAVYYGICHAMHLLAKTRKQAAFWKELRTHFLYVYRGIDGIMYTGDASTRCSREGSYNRKK